VVNFYKCVVISRWTDTPVPEQDADSTKDDDRCSYLDMTILQRTTREVTVQQVAETPGGENGQPNSTATDSSATGDLGSNSTWLDSTRLDTFDFVEPVEPVE